MRQSRSDADNLALCPILDFANHSGEESHIFPVINAEIWATSLDKNMKTGGDFIFISRSDRCIEAGEELFLRYGSHPNHKLFVEYGFVNEFPEDSIRTGHLSGELNVQDIMESLLDNLGPRASLIVDVLKDEGYWG